MIKTRRVEPELLTNQTEIEKCQGDHGRYGANYRCCLPALAGFVSPHSMGPGTANCGAAVRGLQEKLTKLLGRIEIMTNAIAQSLIAFVEI